ncbi:MAG: hypothetical protein KJ072_21125 [Verrucomicrobia bacterium]|nr:hypothetical protein [Verrucomicrobiota bacterium]
MSENDVRFFLGIESVGMSSSVAVLTDDCGTVLNAVKGPPFAGHTTDPMKLRTGLHALVWQAMTQNGRRRDIAKTEVCIGLTGVTFPYDAQVYLQAQLAIANVNPGRLICTGDAEIVTASHTQLNTASAILAHMGSTAYVVCDGSPHRYGGWGPTIGDEGSGFFMGRAALRLVADEYDRSRRPSILWREIEQWLRNPPLNRPHWNDASKRWSVISDECEMARVEKRTALFALAHRLAMQDFEQWRAVASGIVMPLIRASHQRHKGAAKIVRRGARDLATQYARLCGQQRFECSKHPLVLYGGVLTHNPQFRNLVMTELRRQAGDLGNVVLAGDEGTMRPACGAALLALGGSDALRLRLPATPIIKQLHATQAQPPFRSVLLND